MSRHAGLTRRGWRHGLAAAGLCLWVASLPTGALADDAPYTVDVWARVLFGPDGKPLETELVDAAQYPPAFASQVLERLARTRIPPPEVAGQPVHLRTGVALKFAVQPHADGGGTAQVSGIHMGPLPVKRYFASYPKDVARSRGWQGEATGVCQVGIDGVCHHIAVQALPGVPESVRRYVQASLSQWQFEPQQVDGQPIAGEHRLTLRLNTLDNRPEDFRQDKFMRILRQR